MTFKHWLLGAFLAALLVVTPLVAPSYLTFQLTGVMAYAVAAIGLNLIIGYAGQISLGHNAFFALGAYTAALSVAHLQVHYVVSVLIAAAVTFVVGFLAGFPQDAWVYYVVLMFTVVCFFLARNFVAGSTGRALTAVRQAPLAASSMGVDVNGYKVLIFGLGSMFAGIGGAIFNFSIGFIAPDSFNLLLSVSFLAAIVVGGLGTVWGALVAGLFLQFVPSYASDISNALAGAVYGGILIVCMFFMPKGIVGSAIVWLRERRLTKH